MWVAVVDAGTLDTGNHVEHAHCMVADIAPFRSSLCPGIGLIPVPSSAMRLHSQSLKLHQLLKYRENVGKSTQIALLCGWNVVAVVSYYAFERPLWIRNLYMVHFHYITTHLYIVKNLQMHENGSLNSNHYYQNIARYSLFFRRFLHFCCLK